MATIAGLDTCPVTMIPVSRRFYVHVASLGFLVAAQPSMFDEVATALALSGASRALDQAVEDWAMFSSARLEHDLRTGAEQLHDHAADALRLAFQCMAHLVLPRFGATELRRSPDYDPSLQMISGQSLFLFDQKAGTGPGSALFYRQQAARLLRVYRPSAVPRATDDDVLDKIIGNYVSPVAATFDGDSVLDVCLRRAGLMVAVLVNNLPSAPAAAPPQTEPVRAPAGQ